MSTFLNGSFVDEAKVSAFDASVQHGVGLFETMRAEGDHVVRLVEHLERLQNSARELRLMSELHIQPLADAVVETVTRAGHARSRVRLTLTGGDLALLAPDSKRHTPTILIHSQPATEYPDSMFERGVLVTFTDLRANPFDPHEGHKTIHYWPRLGALQDASAKGAAEGIVLTVTNHVAGGCVSNLFACRDGVLFTAPARGEEERGAMPSPVLPGVTRRAILEYAADHDLEVRRQWLTVEDLLRADEVFLTNSSWTILPVRAIEAHDLGDPGPITRMLRDAI